MSSVFCTLEALDPLLNEIVTRCEEGQLQHFETTWVLQPVWCGKALGGISANAVLPAEGWCGKALGGSSANVVLPTENCGGEAPRGISANAVLPEGPDLEGGVISEAVATENRMNASEDEFGPSCCIISCITNIGKRIFSITRAISRMGETSIVGLSNRRSVGRMVGRSVQVGGVRRDANTMLPIQN